MPKVAEAHHELGEVLLARGHLNAAIQHFREAVRLKPEFEPAQQSLQRLTRGEPERFKKELTQ